MSATGSDRLRIAMVYDALYPFQKGGAERRCYEIATRLGVRHDVHLVSWRYGADEAAPAGVTLDPVGAAPAFYGDDGRRTIREAVSFAGRLWGRLLRSRYDVIDCSATPYLPVYSCWAAARLRRTPLVVTWHELWGEYWHAYLPDRPAVARLARRAEAGCLPLGDVAVAVSGFTRSRLAAGRRSRPVTVVENGIDLVAIGAAPAAQPATDLLFVGRLIADKRVDDLLHALAHLRPHHELRCVIVGDGPERASLQRLASRLGLEAAVTFAGTVDDGELFGRMKSATALVLPSVREGFGITVLEAMAAGAIPVVVRAPMSAAGDLVTHGEDGIVCGPGADSLAGAIGRLFGDPTLQERLRAGAIRSAASHDWSRTATAMERIYHEVVHAARGEGETATGVSWA